MACLCNPSLSLYVGKFHLNQMEKMEILFTFVCAFNFSIPMIRNIRYRRDQRQLEEEEEIWFNEEDDFSDVVPTSKADIETYSKHSPNFIPIYGDRIRNSFIIFHFAITRS